jgi:hypothetical protein
MTGKPTSISRLAVVHWFPIEYYPPATNLLNFLSNEKAITVACYTTHNPKKRKPFKNDNITIVRDDFPSADKSKWQRLLCFLSFQIWTTLRLIATWPKTVIYIEPQSAFPVAAYAAINWRAKIFCHHHEYHDPVQFNRPGMLLARFNHKIEKAFLFRRCVWISHTNEKRMELFKRDIPALNDSVLKILPNYPPKSWLKHGSSTRADAQSSGPLKLVYVGSLSTTTTFIEELVQWVASANGSATLDVYCYNSDSSISKLFEKSNPPHVRFHSEGIEYEAIPNKLVEFDVGVILYKGETTNYAFNATNKLFEYIAVGLDVWYPEEMRGVKPYQDLTTSPRIVEVDFKQSESLSSARDNFYPRPPFVAKEYYCEEALSSLYQEITHVTK